MATSTMQERPTDLAGLVTMYQAGVWRYLRFLGCDDAQADDLTQETFLCVHRRPPVQRSVEQTGAYLRKVARNLWLMALRKARRLPVIESIEVAERVWNRWAGRDGGDAYLDALRECLEGLDGRGRKAIDLRYESESSREEIAQALEMTPEGVKTLLRRTRELLRDCVERKLVK